jgi:hypothetical protein
MIFRNSRPHQHLIMGFIAGVALLALAAAGATVVLGRPRLAACLVGAWHTTSYVLAVTSTTGATTDTTTFAGLRFQFKPDGTAHQYFTDVTASTDTGTGEVEPLDGTVTFRYNLAGDTIRYTNGRASDMSEQGWDADYAETATCAGDHLTLHGRIARTSDFASTWTIEAARE